jgi:hypothetical protein
MISNFHLTRPLPFTELVLRQKKKTQLLLQRIARLPPLPGFFRHNFDAREEAACGQSLELVLSTTFHNIIDVRTRVDFKKG